MSSLLLHSKLGLSVLDVRREHTMVEFVLFPKGLASLRAAARTCTNVGFHLETPRARLWLPRVTEADVITSVASSRSRAVTPSHPRSPRLGKKHHLHVRLVKSETRWPL